MLWMLIQSLFLLCVGNRDAKTAKIFMDDLASRLANRVQLTTDGYKIYLQAVENAFGGDIDYAMLVKVYEPTPTNEQRKYSPVECISEKEKRISGNPDKKHISTSFVERQNLTMRMSMRRFTRLTNGFSKKVENHIHHLSLYICIIFFFHVRKILRVIPAMEAGLADHF